MDYSKIFNGVFLKTKRPSYGKTTVSQVVAGASNNGLAKVQPKTLKTKVEKCRDGTINPSEGCYSHQGSLGWVNALVTFGGSGNPTKKITLL